MFLQTVPFYFSNKTETVLMSFKPDITVYFLYLYVSIFLATYHDYTLFQTDLMYLMFLIFYAIVSIVQSHVLP